MGLKMNITKLPLRDQNYWNNLAPWSSINELNFHFKHNSANDIRWYLCSFLIFLYFEIFMIFWKILFFLFFTFHFQNFLNFIWKCKFKVRGCKMGCWQSHLSLLASDWSLWSLCIVIHRCYLCSYCILNKLKCHQWE